MAVIKNGKRIHLLKWLMLISIALFSIQPCLSITDSMNGDWNLTSVTLKNTPEADLMARTGDIDNLNFGWPANFDPFLGQSTPPHSYPWAVDPNDPEGTDRIMVVSSFNGSTPRGEDGYTATTKRPDNSVQTIVLNFDVSSININSAILQMFVDDFQAPVWGAQYQVKLNGVRISSIEDVINSLDQTGPIGKLISIKIPDEYLYFLKSGSLSINIDDPTTGAGDGYAIDFVKLLINPKQISHSGTIIGKVTDSSNNQPLVGVLVSAGGIVEASTDGSGSYTLMNVPAGLASVKVKKDGYDSQIKNVDVTANNIAQLDFSLNPHPMNTTYPVMTPTPEELAKWISLYQSAPNAPGTVAPSTNQQQVTPPSGNIGITFSLLPYLQYSPSERNQGICNDCWQWSGTAIMEIQLDYKNNIKDRLSVEYINSNIASSGDDTPCCGGWLDFLAKFYKERGQAVPWSNNNADWKDGSSTCSGSVVSPNSTSTAPAYSIVSINVEKVPTHGIGKDTAISNIKSVLHQGKAVWFAFFLPNKDEWGNFYDFWNNKQEDAIYQIDSANGILYTDGAGHAVVIVGYDETDPTKRSWIVLNSWGMANGQRPNGLFRVNMDMNYDCQYPGFNGNYGLLLETLNVTYAGQVQPSSVNLTGVWTCDDSGTYYLRQLGNELWWDGDGPSNAWDNVAHGTINGNTTTLDYADVPEGSAIGFGKLVINIISNDELSAITKPVSYGGSHWVRSSKSQPPTPQPPMPTTDPWNNPSVRSLIDEWIQQQTNCVKAIYPGAYIDQWGRLCGQTNTTTISCTQPPDHPADWDSYHYLWANNWCPDYYPYAVQDYVELRQSDSTFNDLAECKMKNESCF